MQEHFNPGPQHQPPPLPAENPQTPPPFPGETAQTPPPFPSEARQEPPPPVPPPFPRDTPQEPPAAAPSALPPERTQAEFVEAERMDAGDAAPPGARGRAVGIAVSGEGRPPKLWAWLLLAAAWYFLSSSTWFTVFIGAPLNLAALIFAAVCLARGGLFTGLAVMLLGTAGSLAVYFVGWARFFGA